MRRMLPAAVFFGLGVSCMVPFVEWYHDGMNDEALVLGAAVRMLDGQVPYRDFDMWYPPGTALLCYAWFAVAGPSMFAARLLMAGVAGLLVSLTYLLSDALLDRPFAFLPPLLFAMAGACEWPVLSYHWTAVAAVLALAILLVRFCARGSTGLIVASGVCAGLAGAFLQTEGVVAVIVGVAALWVRREGAGRSLGFFVLGCLCVWVPLLLAMAITGGLEPMAQDLVVRAWSGLYQYRGSPYSLLHVTEAWGRIGAQWPAAWGMPQLAWLAQSLVMASVWTFKYGLYFPVLLGASWVAWRRGGAWRMLVVLWWAWTWIKHDRFDMLYANYVTAPWYLSVALLLEEAWRREWRRFARLAMLGLILLYGAYWNFNARDAFAAVYRVPTHMGMLYGSWVDSTVWGSFYLETSRLTPPGSEAFAWPYKASFYTLSGTRNPTRIDFALPGQHFREEITRAAATLRQRRVPYLYYFPLSPEQRLRDLPAYDAAFFEQETEWMARELTEGYEVHLQWGGGVIYRLRQQDRIR